jgi:hypothetical protein
MAGFGMRKGDLALLVALAGGSTLREAAHAAGLGERTVARRLADPDFRRRVRDVQAEMVGRALAKLTDGMAAAADTLRQLLRARSESVRLGAARALLELTGKVREAAELEQRLRALEERLADRRREA